MNVIIGLFSAIDDDDAVSGAESVSDKEMESKNSWELPSNSNDSVSDNPPPPPRTHCHLTSALPLQTGTLIGLPLVKLPKLQG